MKEMNENLGILDTFVAWNHFLWVFALIYCFVHGCVLYQNNCCLLWIFWDKPKDWNMQTCKSTIVSIQICFECTVTFRSCWTFKFNRSLVRCVVHMRLPWCKVKFARIGSIELKRLVSTIHLNLSRSNKEAESWKIPKCSTSLLIRCAAITINSFALLLRDLWHEKNRSKPLLVFNLLKRNLNSPTTWPISDRDRLYCAALNYVPAIRPVLRCSLIFIAGHRIPKRKKRSLRGSGDERIKKGVCVPVQNLPSAVMCLYQSRSTSHLTSLVYFLLITSP